MGTADARAVPERAGEALQRAAQLRGLLRDRLGLDPAAEIRDLQADILAERDSLSWAPPPGSPVTLSSASPSSSLVGRREELLLLGGLLVGGRLVTVTGPGGVGKTRVAQEVVAAQSDLHADGVRVVELAPVRDPGSVLAAVAGALALQRRPERSLEDSLVEVLAPLEVLLLLDNCEHLLDVVAPLVQQVLRRCPRVRVLATSREPIGLPGEITWALPPLPVPSATQDTLARLRESHAVELFVDRARAARPGFTLDEQNKHDVAEICVRHDGMPLALELAAARVRSMTCADLASRLDERFKLLAGNRGEPRHRALIDVVTWSHDLLTGSEQELFARLSVFVGSFDLERAEDVCAGGPLGGNDVAGLLTHLVDKSVVLATDSSGRMRYQLLQTLREFARGQLRGRPDELRCQRLHLRSYLATARAAERGLNGPDEFTWVRRVEVSLDDLREAFWCGLRLGEDDLALGLVTALREFAFRGVHDELFGWAEAACNASGDSPRLLYPLGRAMVAYGYFVRGELADAVMVGQEAVETASRLGVTTVALAERAVGNALFYLGETADALQWIDRMVTASRESGQDALVAHACYMASVARTSVGDHSAAMTLATESRLAAQRCRAPTALAQADYAAGLLCEHDDPDRAMSLLHASAETAASVDNRWLRAFARTEELSVRAQHGELVAALEGFLDVVDTWFRGGDWANQWLSVRHLFGLFVEVGANETAAVLHGAIQAAGATTALPFEPGDAARTISLVATVRERLGAAEFSSATERGRSMRDEDVVALTLGHLARLAAARPRGTVTPP